MDICKLVRRYHDGASISKISERLSLARKTVRRYLRKAEEAGLSWEEPLPEREKLLDLLRPLLPDPSWACPAQEQFEDHWPELRELVTRETGPLKPKSAFGIVQQKYSLTASYSSFKRFWRSKQEELGEADPALTCRFEVDPGEEVQIDYGRMGLPGREAQPDRLCLHRDAQSLALHVRGAHLQPGPKELRRLERSDGRVLRRRPAASGRIASSIILP